MTIDPKYPLHQYLQVERVSLVQIRRVLRRAAAALAVQIAAADPSITVSAQIHRMQLEAQRAAIQAQMGITLRDVQGFIVQGQIAADAAATKVIARYERDVFSKALKGQFTISDLVARSEAMRSATTLETLVIRQGSSKIALSERVYKTGLVAKGMVDKAVDDAIVRGLSWKDFAKSVQSLIDPGTPGGVSYAAQRLARTEINNAFHSASIERAKASEFTTGMEWHKSSSHPEHDECDEYEDNSPYAFDEVPSKPHPQCLCYVTPALLDEDEFMTRLLAGDYDDDRF